jgi:hypothetical protein
MYFGCMVFLFDKIVAQTFGASVQRAGNSHPAALRDQWFKLGRSKNCNNERERLLQLDIGFFDDLPLLAAHF